MVAGSAAGTRAEAGRAAPGSAGLHLAAGVPLLHLDEQVFAAMLDGWRAQQLARNLAPATAGRREAMVRSFAVHAGAMPWQWGRRCWMSGSASCAG